MDDQRHVCNRLDRTDTPLVQPVAAGCLQMHIADRDRHRIDARLARELRRLVRIGAGGLSPAMIADKPDLAFAGDAGFMRHLGNAGGLVDVLAQRLLRAVIHQ